MQDSDGASYTLKIRPYKNVENRIDGAVLALFDSASASRHAADLRVARESAEAIISVVREPMLFLATDLRVQKANRAFLEKFGVTAAETESRYLYDIGGRQWDVAPLRQILMTLLERKGFEDFQVEAEFPRLGRRRVMIDGRRLDVRHSDGAAMVLVIRDVTDHAA